MDNDATTPALALDFQEHGVCWFVPEGATIHANEIVLPGGAVIMGHLTGKVICRSGSLIIARSASFSGQAVAQRVYIEGHVAKQQAEVESTILGHELVAISEFATGGANLTSRAYAIHTTTFSAHLTTLSSE
jgi:hypothetical protein